jgi:S1-C subfamily serine protease
MTGSVLDLILLLAVVMFAISGYRQGLVIGLLSFVGFFGGGLLGVQLATPIAKAFSSDPRTRAVIGIIVVFLCAAIGQTLAVTLGVNIRRRMIWQPARQVDAVGGSIISVIAVLLVTWMIAAPLASAPYPWLAKQVRHSAVIRAVDDLMPNQVRKLYDSFKRLVNTGDFPEVFGPLTPTRVPNVDPPDPALMNSAGVRRAAPSIVKIVGTAPSCSRRLEGSGFVFASHRVMTNAHVVAGTRDVYVDANGHKYDAKVVLYNPEKDVAVLDVPDLDRPVLHFQPKANRGDGAVVAGYPLDGPFTVVAARIRGEQTVRGPDIYNDRTVTRDVYMLRAKVRSGNSGGPLLTPNGDVYGVVFAAAADDSDTGFALSAAEVAPEAATGAHATQRVSTQGCD